MEELHVYAPKISACSSEKWLKSVLNYRSYPEIKLGIRFLDHPVYFTHNRPTVYYDYTLFWLATSVPALILSVLATIGLHDIHTPHIEWALNRYVPLSRALSPKCQMTARRRYVKRVNYLDSAIFGPLPKWLKLHMSEWRYKLAGGAYSAPPDPLAGGERARCPLPKNPLPSGLSTRPLRPRYFIPRLWRLPPRI